jgi:hypothetical protein
VLRALGALALLGVAADHLGELTAGHYAVIPTIGTLFTLDVAAATSLAVVLLVPTWRLPGRAGRTVPALAALAGIGVAGGSLVALLVSEHTPLFGFMESGYRVTIVVAIACEAAAVLLLGAALAPPGRQRPRAARVRDSESVSLWRSHAPRPDAANRADAGWDAPATQPSRRSSKTA